MEVKSSKTYARDPEPEKQEPKEYVHISDKKYDHKDFLRALYLIETGFVITTDAEELAAKIYNTRIASDQETLSEDLEYED